MSSVQEKPSYNDEQEEGREQLLSRYLGIFHGAAGSLQTLDLYPWER